LTADGAVGRARRQVPAHADLATQLAVLDDILRNEADLELVELLLADRELFLGAGLQIAGHRVGQPTRLAVAWQLDRAGEELVGV
jgi:hypothetical protein